MERYYRHIVYHKWFPGDIFRPMMSFPNLADAVKYVDTVGESGDQRTHKIIDLEHIDMGDMLIHPDVQDLIEHIRSN